MPWDSKITKNTLEQVSNDKELDNWIVQNMRTPEQANEEAVRKAYDEKNNFLSVAGEFGQAPVPILPAVTEYNEMAIKYELGKLGVKDGAYHTAMIGMSLLPLKSVAGVVKKGFSKLIKAGKTADIAVDAEHLAEAKRAFGSLSGLSEEGIERVARIASSNAPKAAKELSIINYVSKAMPGIGSDAATISAGWKNSLALREAASKAKAVKNLPIGSEIQIENMVFRQTENFAKQTKTSTLYMPRTAKDLVPILTPTAQKAEVIRKQSWESVRMTFTFRGYNKAGEPILELAHVGTKDQENIKKAQALWRQAEALASE